MMQEKVCRLVLMPALIVDASGALRQVFQGHLASVTVRAPAPRK